MTQPLYFLPNIGRAQLEPGGKLSRSLLQERGLADVFRDVEAGDYGLNCPHAVGPGGTSGVYLSYQPPGGEPPRLTAYHPQEQTWHEVNDGLWLGLDNSSPPRPEEMRRKKQVGGYLTPLGDGNSWLIPIIRQEGGGTQLPQNFTLNGHGLEMSVKPAYRDHWERSAVVAEWMYRGKNTESFTLEEAVNRTIEALGINYRFGRAEQNVLALIDTTNWELVLAATVDVPKAMKLQEEAQKKSIAEIQPSESISPGSVGS